MNEFEDSMVPLPDPGASRKPPRPPKITARGLEDDPGEDGSILDEIERRLARFPEARVRRDATSISCLPSDRDGFRVCLKVGVKAGKPVYSVFYNGAREDFSVRNEAVVTFGFGLSNGCRLKEYMKRGAAYRWVVELRGSESERWTPHLDYDRGPDSLRWFFSKPVVLCLQNHLIDLDGDQFLSVA